MELELYQLKNLMIDCVEIGYKKALVEMGEIKSFLTKSEAYKRYGRTTVDRWISERLIIPHKDGSKSAMVRLDRMRLEILAKSSNRHTYKETKERK